MFIVKKQPKRASKYTFGCRFRSLKGKSEVAEARRSLMQQEEETVRGNGCKRELMLFWGKPVRLYIISIYRCMLGM